jgi:hypothetical protein
MNAQPANEPDKQPRGKFIGAFHRPMGVVACGLSAQFGPRRLIVVRSEFWSIG